MLIYVAHKYSGDEKNIERAKQITHDLQIADPENTYITPLLAFSHLKYNEQGYDDEIEHCMELLRMCDVLIVASEESKGIKLEILEAEEMGIEIKHVQGVMEGG